MIISAGVQFCLHTIFPLVITYTFSVLIISANFHAALCFSFALRVRSQVIKISQLCCGFSEDLNLDTFFSMTIFSCISLSVILSRWGLSDVFSMWKAFVISTVTPSYVWKRFTSLNIITHRVIDASFRLHNDLSWKILKGISVECMEYLNKDAKKNKMTDYIHHGWGQSNFYQSQIAWYCTQTFWIQFWYNRGY